MDIDSDEELVLSGTYTFQLSRKGYLQLREIAEWQFPDNYKEADELVYADYVPLMEIDTDGCQPTGKLPKHSLDLPQDFWTT